VGQKGAGEVATHSPGLIDTDILIDASRGVADSVNFLTTQHAQGIQVSIITAMELTAGCRNASELSQIQQFVSGITVSPITEAISQTAHELMERFTLSHGLQIPDALIASTAMEHELTLYSKNIRHFRMIPDLSVVRPY
jgi:predicted nucleic acid-binding protein